MSSKAAGAVRKHELRRARLDTVALEVPPAMTGDATNVICHVLIDKAFVGGIRSEGNLDLACGILGVVVRPSSSI